MFLKDIYNKYSEDGIQIDLREDSSTDIMSLIANNLSDIGLCCIYDCHMSAFTEQLNVIFTRSLVWICVLWSGRKTRSSSLKRTG